VTINTTTPNRSYRSNCFLRCNIRVSFLALASILCGCSFEHHPFRAGDKATESNPEVHFVEADDYGWLWEPRQALEALDAVRLMRPEDCPKNE
jgi:hypothetical protein